jgi:hypothetical protein
LLLCVEGALKHEFRATRACGEGHVGEASVNRPSALTLLDGLIRVCDEVRSEIAIRIKTNETKALALDLPPTTTAEAFLATLTATTTETQVEAATALAEGTNERLGRGAQGRGEAGGDRPAEGEDATDDAPEPSQDVGQRRVVYSDLSAAAYGQGWATTNFYSFETTPSPGKSSRRPLALCRPKASKKSRANGDANDATRPSN